MVACARGTANSALWRGAIRTLGVNLGARHSPSLQRKVAGESGVLNEDRTVIVTRSGEPTYSMSTARTVAFDRSWPSGTGTPPPSAGCAKW